MTSDSYYNSTAADSPVNSGGDFSGYKGRARKVQNRYIRELERAGESYRNLPAERQRAIQDKLNRLRKNNPQIKGAAASATSSFPKLISSITGILKQVDLSSDWMFLFVLVPFALLKDIFDVAFAVIPGVGVALSFVAELMLIILTVVILLLSGSSMKNRGMTKYVVGLVVAFASEAFPGIGWLPLAFIEAFILYGMVLLDRTMEPKESQKNSTPKGASSPQPSAAGA
jgi:hypothetical protein